VRFILRAEDSSGISFPFAFLDALFVNELKSDADLRAANIISHTTCILIDNENNH